MSSRNQLDDSLRWRFDGRLEAGQCQETMKAVSSSWNQFQTNVTNLRRPGQVRPRKRTSSQDRYLTLSTRRHRQTATTDFSRDLDASSGIRFFSQTVHRCLDEESLHARLPLVYLHSVHIPQESQFVVVPNTLLLDTPRMRTCSFHW